MLEPSNTIHGQHYSGLKVASMAQKSESTKKRQECASEQQHNVTRSKDDYF